MFLQELIKRNQKLIDFTLALKKQNKIDPNTYVIDLDHVEENAQKLFAKSQELGIELYLMAKQFGRNPLVARTIAQTGINKAVCVDWYEAHLMHQNNIKIGNVGHIVQVPINQIAPILKMNPDVWTIYSLANAKILNQEAQKLKIKQKILLRVWDQNTLFYDSQLGGIKIDQLATIAQTITKLSNLEIVGLTSFPVLLFNEKNSRIEPTSNYDVMLEAKKILEKLAIKVSNFNLPSCNNVKSLPLIKKLGGTSAEPGHAFTGTTPISKNWKNVETPAMLYYSEISHLHQDLAIAYAGGHYRRGRQSGALIGYEQKFYKYQPLAPEAIDYYYEFLNPNNDPIKVGDPVIMNFRAQIFVTRANVLVVKGLKNNMPKIMGLFDAQGRKIG